MLGILGMSFTPFIESRLAVVVAAHGMDDKSTMNQHVARYDFVRFDA